MNGPTPNGPDEAIRAFLSLAVRGRCPSEPGDVELLARPIPRGAITWDASVREAIPGSGIIAWLGGARTERLTTAERSRLGVLTGQAYAGFFSAAAEGIALTSPARIRERFGDSIEQNYPEAGEAFRRFALTYWTMKVFFGDGVLYAEPPLVYHALEEIDRHIGPLFFPMPGPIKTISPAMRERDQRFLLEAVAPPSMAIEDFLRGNPILIRDRKKTGGPGRLMWLTVMVMVGLWLFNRCTG